MRKRCFRIAGAMCGAFLVCGLAVLPVFAENGTWKNNETGYWYEHTDGGYTRDGWEKIDGKWYYFFADGTMAVNTEIDGYRIGMDGAMAD